MPHFTWYLILKQLLGFLVAVFIFIPCNKSQIYIPNTGGALYYKTGGNCPDPYSILKSDYIIRWPLAEYKVTQYYNYLHPAMDLSAKYDTPIEAVGFGFVTTSEYMLNGYGWYVIVKHPQGWETLYAHMHTKPEVKVGDYIYPGKLLGFVGSTGHSTGPHLHFEILLNGCNLDPNTVIEGHPK